MKKRLIPALLAAALLLCASCVPVAEVIPALTPTAASAPEPTPTPAPTAEPTPALTGLEGELQAAVEDFFALKRDAVNGVDIPRELADSRLGREAAARAAAMRAWQEEQAIHIVSIETELRDFLVRWVKDDAAQIGVYEWTWVNYNGDSGDKPATDRMGWGLPHDVTLTRNGGGVYEVTRDRSGEVEETNYKSELCAVSTNYDWLGNGYAYMSEKMKIRVEFPPEWEQYFTFEEKEVEGLLRSGSSGRVIELAPESALQDGPDCDTAFARIYWLPKGEEGADPDGKVTVTLWGSDEGEYVCEVPATHQPEPDPNPGAGGPHPEYGELRAAYETVYSGILAREWEIDVLRK